MAHRLRGGYDHTFPKGTVEGGLSLQKAATKEVWEESGLEVRITGWLGDFEKSASMNRYHLVDRVGGAPWGFGEETQSVKLVTLDEAENWMRGIPSHTLPATPRLPMDPLARPSAARHIEHIDDARRIAPPLSKNVMLTRFCTPDDLVTQLEALSSLDQATGIVFTDHGYSSAALYKNWSWSGKVRMKIEVEAGTRLINGEVLRSMSEYELVVPRSSKFVIKEAKRRGGSGWDVVCRLVPMEP